MSFQALKRRDSSETDSLPITVVGDHAENVLVQHVSQIPGVAQVNIFANSHALPGHIVQFSNEFVIVANDGQIECMATWCLPNVVPTGTPAGPKVTHIRPSGRNGGGVRSTYGKKQRRPLPDSGYSVG